MSDLRQKNTKGHEPAYPVAALEEFVQDWAAQGMKGPWRYTDRLGLTKREHFAGLALQGFITRGLPIMSTPEIERVSSLSVRYADALLGELEKPNV